MKHIILILAIFAIAAPSFAEEICLNWTPVSDSDLVMYRVYRKLTGGEFLPTDGIAEILCGPGDASCATYTDDVGPGTWYYAVTPVYRDGTECPECSNVFSKTIRGMISDLGECD